ncbi:hypothetical protein QQF64_011532 [Cirrhinus molitorella]|uniref:Secreted protein n=1 Tax=Cirrhinus molitorella TaxID=172907 RepID=A0ABR3M3N5_9TELE
MHELLFFSHCLCSISGLSSTNRTQSESAAGLGQTFFLPAISQCYLRHYLWESELCVCVRKCVTWLSLRLD